MTAELLGVVVGGTIGTVGSLATTLLITTLSNRRRRKAIRSIVKAEIVAIEEKAARFVEGESTKEEVAASTPMLTSIASEIGFLTPEEAVAFRRVVTLDMEMRHEGSEQKARMVLDACSKALQARRK